jgi:putative ABC transport system substrate-binding protein
VPRAERFGALISPTLTFDTVTADLTAAAAAIGRPLDIFTATNSREIDAAFARMVQKRVDAFLVSPGVFVIVNRRVQVVTLAAHHHLPAVYYSRDFVEVGGLMSYGSSVAYHFAQAGIYVGRILKGEKPADLPVMGPTKFEFVINLQTARTLGIEVPPTLLALADEVVE